MTLSEANLEAFEKAAALLGIRLTRIGKCCEGKGLGVTFDGEPMDLPLSLGWGM